MIGGASEGSGVVARLTALGLSLLKKVDMVGVQACRACVMHDEGRGEAKKGGPKRYTRKKGVMSARATNSTGRRMFESLRLA